ncbi:ABC transporter permease [Parvularcula maris]|uniref:ABC transporter permease n=1 Tax=Parvularcula maris TaxID=2965077 RepID=A0A9X2L8P9_9PROT|nr:ABC transporter permease [Parvularcula maris]MCQ8185150.1 ABC transporter permease [Parvularcula maris]
MTISVLSGMKGVWSDILRGAALSEVWVAFANDEIQNRYRRSAVGLLWIAISYLLWVFGLALFFGGFSDLEGRAFTAYVAFGFAIFSFLLSNIVDGCSVFVVNSGWVRSASLPYSIYVFKSVARSLFPFAIQIACAFITMPFFGWRLDLSALMALPALVIAVVTAVPLQYLLGLICARLRDIGHFVQAISRLLLFSSPILWVYDEALGLRRLVATINPMTSFIEIFRNPLLGKATPLEHYAIAVSSCAAVWALCLLVGSSMRRKLPFWV